MPRIKHLSSLLSSNFDDREAISAWNLRDLGLLIPNPKRDVSGKKIFQDFFLPLIPLELQKPAVRIYFSDVIENDKIIKIKKRLVYYSDDDKGLGKDNQDFIWFEKEKDELVKDELNLKISRYKSAYSRLVYEAENNDNVNVRTIYSTLLDFFLQEIQKWLLGNPKPFLDRLNDTNLPTSIKSLLNLTVLANSVKTVKDGIIERVSGTKWVEPK